MFCCGSDDRHRWDSGREDWQPGEPERGMVDGTGQGPELRVELRVSQAERDEVAAALAKHYADGRLTLGEYEERVGSALEARTRSDFEPLLADLPRNSSRRGGTRRDRRPFRPPPVIVAVAAVVLLAFAVGPWALWLLWPALVLTGGCGRRSHSHRRVDSERATTSRPASTRPPAPTRV